LQTLAQERLVDLKSFIYDQLVDWQPRYPFQHALKTLVEFVDSNSFG